ncbi:MAG: 2-C-methyl-D-erythritol 4-phosphate cytidylyltransferase [Ruminococcaceae bacterium]|nr:2-C-methyl-D-erythritol 4-phosphate cytidylyltransferase [Oscillospiraceae bacterium]
MGASVIIAAAGTASRMQGTDKIMYKINGKEVLLHSVLAFKNAGCTDKIVVVTSADKIEKITDILNNAELNLPFEVVRGGETRQKSVLNGLGRCCDSSDCIMIHDAARPMISPELIKELYKKVVDEKIGAAAVGVKVKDTIKEVSESGVILSTPDRNSLVAIQTPQCFETALYKKAFEEAEKQGRDYTDDCQLVEAIGKSVYVVEGDYKNIKITTPDDLILAETFLKEREK